MKLLQPKTLIAIVSAGAVISLAIVDFKGTAPGEVIAAHARVPELDGGASCSDCHGGWTREMTESCLDCHDIIQQHIDGQLGIHGIIDSVLASNCASCHSEHHGRTFQAVNDMSFVRAGVENRLEFEHRAIGFDLSGAHVELECSECHEHVDAPVVPEGAHRYIGLSQRCVTCHDDVHEGAYLTTCVVCHVQDSFHDVWYVGHDNFLPLQGAHGELACAECHEDGSSHSLATLRGPAKHRPAYRNCEACHDQPHSTPFIARNARATGIDDTTALVEVDRNRLCADCHQPDDLRFDASAERLTARQHRASDFPLAVPHADVACADCHDPTLDYDARYPGRRAWDCVACHDDPHANQFAGLAFGPEEDFAGGEVDSRGCIVCHERTHFEPHAFGVLAHAQTDLPLEGVHLETDCADCHPNVGKQGDQVRLFHGVDHTCQNCHEDAHAGFFDEHLATLEDTPKHGDCARCHDAASFAPAIEGSFDHGEWTGFDLTGAHAAAECSSCHPAAAERDATGRVFGRITDVYGEVSGCASCHDDVHDGRFDQPVRGRKVRTEVDGRLGCARCHTTTSFRDLAYGFDHGRWTGWRLEGAHEAADCTSCHPPIIGAGRDERTWHEAAGSLCADCHESPHRDQFTGKHAKRCESCHQSAEGFSILSFDHDLESRFPLDDAHEEVGCAECHKPEEDGFVRYRPLARECVDCHGVHEKALRKRRRKR